MIRCLMLARGWRVLFLLGVLTGISFGPAAVHATAAATFSAARAPASSWTVSLTSYQTVVETGVSVQLVARVNHPVEQGKHRVTILDLGSRTATEGCTTGSSCPATVDSLTPRTATYQAVVRGAKGKTVAVSKKLIIRWIKFGTWQITLSSPSFIQPDSDSGTLPLGEPLLLRAATAQKLEARHSSIAIFAFDAQGKRSRVPTSCTTGTVCQIAYPSPSAEDSRTFLAAVLGRAGKIADESPLLVAGWKQLHITLTGGDTATAGSSVQLTAGWDMVIPAALHTWTLTANGQVDQAATAKCEQDAAANPSARSCTVSVQASGAGSVTYQLDVAPAAGGAPLASASHGVNWTAPAVTASAHLTASPARHDFVAGSSVQLTLTATPPADGKATFLQIVGSDGSTVARCASGTTCIGNATSAATGTVTYTGEEVDASGKVLASDTWSINWFRFSVTAVPQGITGNTVAVGTTVTLAVAATPTPAGFTLVLTGGGLTLRCPTTSPLSCFFQLTSATAQTVTYSIQVFDDATGQAASGAVTVPITWGAAPPPFTFTYTVSPGTTVNVGTTVTIQVNASPAAAGTVAAITDGTHTYTCPAPSTWTCSFTFQSSVPQIVTYTIYVQGDFADAKQVMVQWTQPTGGGGTASLGLSPSSGAPSSTFTATWTESSLDACDSTGKLTVTIDGQSVGSPQPDPAGIVTFTISMTNAAPGSHTITVSDSCGESASATYTVVTG